MLRGVAADLVARVKAYAQTRDLSVQDAAVALLDQGLRATERGAQAATARAASLTPERRADIARTAAQARWRTP